MKLIFTKSLRLIFLLALLLAAASLSAQAQAVRLNLNNLNQLESKASESVDVSLDGPLLKLAFSFLKDSDPKQLKIKEAISGIKGIYVKAFVFEKEGAYAPTDVDSIRAQVRASGWSKMVGVKS